MRKIILIGLSVLVILISSCAKEKQVSEEDKNKFLSQYCEEDSDCILETELWKDSDCSHICVGDECTEDLRLCKAYYRFSIGNIEAKRLCKWNEPCKEPTEIKCVNNQCQVKEEKLEKQKEICEIGKEYQNTAVNPVGCECQEGYEFEIVSMGWGPCPKEGMMDCPASVLKCVKQEQTAGECATDSDCGIGGCSGQICGPKDEVKDIITTCEWLPEYACYQKTSCSCANEKCQWKETDEFLNCMKTAKSSSGITS